MTHLIEVKINLSALRHNLNLVRSIIGPSRKILAMVKANAYGHGAIQVAQALSAANAFGVASIEEAIQLREANIQLPIAVMSRFYRADQVELCYRYRLTPVINQLYQIKLLEAFRHPEPIDVWLKLETGMHRLGLTEKEFIEAYQRLNQLDWVRKPIGLMMHFACADTPDHPLNKQQLRLFHQFTDRFPGPKSTANSAAILSMPDSLMDWVRPGLMLYGASPFLDKSAEQLGLQPVMTFSSILIAIRHLAPGDCIGYGATWQCQEATPVGIVAIGYGDGYPRHARTGTPVLVNGKRCPLIGRISMDMIAVDLRAAPGAAVGDQVILWGQGLPSEQVAVCSETIPYELFCNVKRVEFSYHD